MSDERLAELARLVERLADELADLSMFDSQSEPVEQDRGQRVRCYEISRDAARLAQTVGDIPK